MHNKESKRRANGKAGKSPAKKRSGQDVLWLWAAGVATLVLLVLLVWLLSTVFRPAPVAGQQFYGQPVHEQRWVISRHRLERPPRLR